MSKKYQPISTPNHASNKDQLQQQVLSNPVDSSTQNPGEQQLAFLQQSIGNAEMMAALTASNHAYQRTLQQQMLMNVAGMSVSAAGAGNQALLAAMQSNTETEQLHTSEFCGESIPAAIQTILERQVTPAPVEESGFEAVAETGQEAA